MLNTVKKQDGDALTVLLDGRLDTHTAAGFQEEMEPLLSGISSLTLDCEKLNYISSAGLRVLLTIEQEMEDQNKPMQLCHVSDVIRDVFDVTGFLDILTIV
jgi:anti-sigma B factor antagonist